MLVTLRVYFWFGTVSAVEILADVFAVVSVEQVLATGVFEAELGEVNDPSVKNGEFSFSIVLFVVVDVVNVVFLVVDVVLLVVGFFAVNLLQKRFVRPGFYHSAVGTFDLSFFTEPNSVPDLEDHDHHNE